MEIYEDAIATFRSGATYRADDFAARVKRSERWPLVGGREWRRRRATLAAQPTDRDESLSGGWGSEVGQSAEGHAHHQHPGAPSKDGGRQSRPPIPDTPEDDQSGDS